MTPKEWLKSWLPPAAFDKVKETAWLWGGRLQCWNLDRLARFHGTDKADVHRYAQHYDRHFRPRRWDALNLLEIGIGGYKRSDFGGQSLRMWRSYFPRARIVGIDKYDKRRQNGYHIQTFQGSQDDAEFLQRVSQTVGGFDIIIDDGSHMSVHVIKSFEILFPLLHAGGIYVIEDLQTSYHALYGGKSGDPQAATSMNFLKARVDGLNYEEFSHDHTPSYTDQHITQMHFYHNLAFIYKGDNREGSNKTLWLVAEPDS